MACRSACTRSDQFFGRAFRPEEARRFITAQQVQPDGHDPRNLKEQALAMMGPALFEAFFRGYTEKRWGSALQRGFRPRC
ncbi:MAG: hypothetical protein U5K36_06030 [Roseovarius sp.]|nr:hypothetical protein [Roseovarius sp.]